MKELEDLSTERMILRRVTEADLEDFTRMYRDERVMATLGGVVPAEEARRRLGLHVEHWERHGFGWWTLRDPDRGQFIGRGGVKYYSLDGRDELELGYGLMSEYWGKGLATELSRETLRVAFTVLNASELICFTLPNNVGSRRVMEKVGFHYEKDFVHADLPHVLYRLTAAEWRSL
jgi:RimJ/RimL family protein N-acetyltransferase